MSAKKAFIQNTPRRVVVLKRLQKPVRYDILVVAIVPSSRNSRAIHVIRLLIQIDSQKQARANGDQLWNEGRRETYTGGRVLECINGLVPHTNVCTILE